MNIICESFLFTIPFIAVLVVCTLFAVAATFMETFFPINLLNIVDLPTFGLPTIVTNPDLNSAILFPFYGQLGVGSIFALCLFFNLFNTIF